MANVTLTEVQAEVIRAALAEADKTLSSLERLAQTGKPIRRDDIQFPTLRAALNKALAHDYLKPAEVTSTKRKK